MKQEHQDLLIDLLIEKIDTLKKASDIVKSAGYKFRHICEGFVSNPARIQEYIDLYDARIEELIQQCKENTKRANEAEQRIEQLTKERDDALMGKEERRAMAASLTQLRMMVEYAKTQGFKFMKLDKMKEAIDSFRKEQLDKIAKMKENTQDTQDCVTQPCEKPKDKDYQDFAFNNKHQKSCPHGVEDRKGHTAVLAGIYCRNKCPYCQGADFDQLVIHCDKK